MVGRDRKKLKEKVEKAIENELSSQAHEKLRLQLREALGRLIDALSLEGANERMIMVEVEASVLYGPEPQGSFIISVRTVPKDFLVD
jgi:hypothetical protein